MASAASLRGRVLDNFLGLVLRRCRKMKRNYDAAFIRPPPVSSNRRITGRNAVFSEVDFRHN